MTGFTKSEPDRIHGMEEVALVLDCTVLPVNKTGKEFNCGSDCFSGKHKIYCAKVEVGVNPKTGTASSVSKVHGGAVHDYVMFREHYSQFAARLEGGKIMADSDYIGAESEFRAIITKPVGTPKLAAH
ncbi:putative DDE superfamily endonuclease [Monocercomonoides exilis]|uniref:putative DDE superfamily endonuclease n=1 Tax=Monocercomonoides exilis TaxID=2049356 RepID=UPI00355A44E2|nr:putative DDE superfamily endonuclease [Monocercomonoides exilis]|eukprot:MONOS_16593.1-p1 / transcript=MONOS_16593.1 / gene=MONOS_16593 / organism=Monocercomonoides_exilis_PA203 / gene_product=unspecified product / transcript_product=unspecified product / location=Mono_scaffold01894:691-1317(+) / protein_length=127 / sequence_SO=supercontig / SO=protein_coding / is_pseudo=false